MHNYLNKIKIFFFLISIACFILFFNSCLKEENKGAAPTLSFKIDSNYIYEDDTVLIGKTFKVGINATKGDVNITNLIIKVIHDSTFTYLDTGMNTASFSITKTIIKGVAPKETWTFIVRDKTGNSQTAVLHVYSDTNSVYGNINTIPSIQLGAQNNTAIGSFLDIKNELVYPLSQAYLLQDSIEILYYYDAIQTDANTIASPNANLDPSVFSGNEGLSNWTIKNETRYIKTNLTNADFENCDNDSILIANYNETLAKRKAKNLTTGDIYIFRTAKNKLGMFKVIQVSGQESGFIEIKVKIQPS